MKKTTEQFIKRTRKQLADMFEERLDELRESVFKMEAGEKRDATILFIREYQSWLRIIGVLTANPIEKAKDPEFI